MTLKSLSLLILIMCVAVGAQAAGFNPDWLPISGWVQPQGDKATLAAYKEMAESGLTLSMGHPSNIIEFGQKAGLKMIIQDPRLYQAQVQNETECDTLVDAVAAEFGNKPGVIGFMVRDEPSQPDFPRLARISKRLQEKVPGCVPFINLYPNTTSDWKNDPKLYEDDYVRRFVREVQPPVLCFDHYPLVEETFDQLYYSNLESIRRVTMEAGIPFWAFIQLTGYNKSREATEAEMRLQVYSVLAYGGKGYSYFCYWDPGGDGLFKFEGGIISKDGQRTDHFADAQRINKRAQALGKYLLGMRSTGVYHVGTIYKGCQPLPEDAVVRPKEGFVKPRFFYRTGQLIFGFFEDAKGEKWAMVVNRDYAHNVHTRFALSPKIAALEEVAGPDWIGADRLTPEGADRLVALRFYPGDARLFRLVEAK
ncbi:MAG: hypothetical protein Q7N50_07135 [Armatimonadota bacterium]|nr:hypothetical protein [Armatimonadota bacterium]